MAFSAPAALAADAAAGSATRSSITVSAIFGGNPSAQELRQVSFNLAQPSQCVAVASANAVNPVSGDDRRYTFGLTLDTISNSSSNVLNRVIDFDNLSGEQVDREEVSSTGFFPNLAAGPHTIRWVASKNSDSFPNLEVEAASLSVMCFDTLL
jgi:hypothetical protein